MPNKYDIERELTITGRGLVFVIDTKNYPNAPIKLRDIIEVKGKLYEVRGIERAHHQTSIGVVVLPLK